MHESVSAKAEAGRHKTPDMIRADVSESSTSGIEVVKHQDLQWAVVSALHDVRPMRR